MKKLIKNLRVILLVTIVFSFSGAVKQAAIKDNYITIYPTEDTTSLRIKTRALLIYGCSIFILIRHYI